MITIILEAKTGREVARCCNAGNEAYLIRSESRFPKLSALSDIDYDVFSQFDMPELIGELVALRRIVGDKDQTHIDEIIELAVRCRDDGELTLAFTPFE